jgi:Spy/CpxP family protein refolding chaperone
LLALRGGLQPLYVEQQQAMEDLFSGEVDFQELRETMREMQMEMRTKIMGSLSEVLDEEQIETLKAHMKEQQERRSRFGGGGGPRGGGPRGGGGGGGF